MARSADRGVLEARRTAPVPANKACNPDGVPCCPLDDAEAATMSLGRGPALTAAEECAVWAAIGFTPVQSVSDKKYFLQPSSPKPHWDDALVNALIGTPGVIERNRGGCKALSGHWAREYSHGDFEGEQRIWTKPSAITGERYRISPGRGWKNCTKIVRHARGEDPVRPPAKGKDAGKPGKSGKDEKPSPDIAGKPGKAGGRARGAPKSATYKARVLAAAAADA